jgi:hypothetical protein
LYELNRVEVAKDWKSIMRKIEKVNISIRNVFINLWTVSVEMKIFSPVALVSLVIYDRKQARGQEERVEVEPHLTKMCQKKLADTCLLCRHIRPLTSFYTPGPKKHFR